MIEAKLIKVNDNSLSKKVIKESDLGFYLSEYEDLNKLYVIRCCNCNALLSIANKTKTIHFKLKNLSEEEKVTESENQVFHKQHCKININADYRSLPSYDEKYNYLKSDITRLETLLYEFLTDKNNTEKSKVFLSDEVQNEKYFTYRSPFKIFRIKFSNFYEDKKDSNTYYCRSKDKILGKSLTLRIDKKVYETNKTKIEQIYAKYGYVLVAGILYKGEYNSFINPNYNVIYLNKFGTKISKNSNIVFGN